ncbi:MAG TPA: SMC-Scp complex subunit ScpB [Rhodopila sp.]|nr:SMC-Scp complex subunit ScpB [Rhodopila sp.]
MTDARTEIPADHDAEQIETESVPASAGENARDEADLTHQAVVPCGAEEAAPALGDAEPAANVTPDPAASDGSPASHDGGETAKEADADPAHPVDADTTFHSDADSALKGDMVTASDAESAPRADKVTASDADLITQVDADAAPQVDATVTPPSTPPLRDPDDAALRLAEAAVFASATPMTPRALSQILPDDLDPAAVIAMLRTRYEGRGLELIEIGGGLQFRTAADLAPQLRKVVQVPRRLPRVALETLAIVAYHQPITRPEIEDLRGTGLSQQTLDTLLENDLIVSRGRKETPGRPTLWGTTPKFLEYFGLRDIRELPRRQDLLLEAIRPAGEAETPSAASEDAQSGPPDTLPA